MAPELVAVKATETRFRVLTHPISGDGFDEHGRGMWPADQNTYRLRDEGALKIVPTEPAEPKATAAKPTKSADTPQER